MTSPNIFAAALSAAALAALAGSATAQPGAATPARNGPCFYVTQWRGWKAPDKNTLYLRVNLHDIYRVDLSAGSDELKWPGNHLTSQVRGSSSICGPLDLDLSVSDGHGFHEPLIARALYRLSPDEVAAIPAKDLP